MTRVPPGRFWDTALLKASAPATRPQQFEALFRRLDRCERTEHEQAVHACGSACTHNHIWGVHRLACTAGCFGWICLFVIGNTDLGWQHRSCLLKIGDTDISWQHRSCLIQIGRICLLDPDAGVAKKVLCCLEGANKLDRNGLGAVLAEILIASEYSVLLPSETLQPSVSPVLASFSSYSFQSSAQNQVHSLIPVTQQGFPTAWR